MSNYYHFQYGKRHLYLGWTWRLAWHISRAAIINKVIYMHLGPFLVEYYGPRKHAGGRYDYQNR